MQFLLYVLPVLLLVLAPLLAFNCYKAIKDPLESFDKTSGSFSRVGNWAGIVLSVAAVLWALWRLYQLFFAPM